MKSCISLALLCTIVLQIIKSARAGFITTVDAHNEECFFEKAEGGTKLGNFSYFCQI